MRKKLYWFIWKLLLVRSKYLRRRTNKASKKLTKLCIVSAKHNDMVLQLETIILHLNN
jgi:hypothetical protein